MALTLREIVEGTKTYSAFKSSTISVWPRFLAQERGVER